ncbi:P27 family phage terminase small subunit [Collinsella sp. AGMB00827]|uniref:P27 family phage terminase small subunit n=1 Tax=Collinsella ureilytica TaxID=2869515 RepID=A0ABS7MHT0_9ACTN|nr:P27 family phage terminase small subunit [Collinsella urealyticum]MBY4796792.1 P27 family phage terminase small subunit [Collinsella urealyticum]
MRGRKADARAVRRLKDGADLALYAGARSDSELEGVEKPASVLAVPSMSALWDTIAASGISWRPEDTPLLEALVFELEAARQCRDRCTDELGNVMPVVGRGMPDPETGEYLDWAPNPWYKAMGEATARALRLSDQLGCTPLARARLGLTQAAGIAVGVSIAEQVRAAVDRMQKQ